VDTYDVIKSGIVNFIAVAVALDKVGYKAVGIRLDSGDLAQFSKDSRAYFEHVAKKLNKSYFAKFHIVASDDINEARIEELEAARHSIDTYGIGTNLVTCQSQPALGCVYKLVELNGIPRIKLSTVAKMTLAGRKHLYRLYKKVPGEKDEKFKLRPICDLMTSYDETPPKVGEEVAVFDPNATSEDKKMIVIVDEVEDLLHLIWDGKARGKKAYEPQPIQELRASVLKNLDLFIPDVFTLKGAGSEFPVVVSLTLYRLLHTLIDKLSKSSL